MFLQAQQAFRRGRTLVGSGAPSGFQRASEDLTGWGSLWLETATWCGHRAVRCLELAWQGGCRATKIDQVNFPTSSA